MGFRVWGLGLEVLGFFRAQGLEGLVLESGRNRLLYGFFLPAHGASVRDVDYQGCLFEGPCDQDLKVYRRDIYPDPPGGSKKSPNLGP